MNDADEQTINVQIGEDSFALIIGLQEELHGTIGDLVDAVTNVGVGLQAIASSIRALGNGDAATTMGAIEGHAVLLRDALREGLINIAHSIDNTADTGATEQLGRIADGAHAISDSISGLGPELLGIGQEIGWGLDPDDNRKNHLVSR